MSKNVSFDVPIIRLMTSHVAKFGSVCFNIKKVINIQSRCGQNPLPPPPLPGLSRVKIWLQALAGLIQLHKCFLVGKQKMF